MPQYNPPLRDMHFVLHEMLSVADELKMLPKHADVDTATINAVPAKTACPHARRCRHHNSPHPVGARSR